ncbi:MAG TPA: branched-chain amino acid transaminase [Actinomycetota bacterium]|nr:branched-chain amino acid transaminase [Actinomycetota bacterium]
MPIEPVDKVWVDGELVDWADAQVHLLTHALHYGTGVFEGIRAYATERGPAVFRLADHVRRLFRSAHLYQMQIPYSQDEMAEACKTIARANGLDACYLRPLVFRGYGEMGLNPLHAPIQVAVVSWVWGAFLGDEGLENGVRVKISSWKRNDQNTLPPGAKATGQYINSGLAKTEALQGGYDEAIMLNMAGFVTDGSGENVFLIKDQVLFTPPLSAGCLDGITRRSVIQIAQDLGYQVVERNLSRFDLYTADEAFFTGTAAEVTPIREVDDRPIAAHGRGPITKELQQMFFDAAHGRLEQYRGWLTYLDG